MIYAAIAGDIIASTSLDEQSRHFIQRELDFLFSKLETAFNVYARITQGDFIECVVPDPRDALRVALIIKGEVKFLSGEKKINISSGTRLKHFKTHGIRLAIGLGKLNEFKPETGIIDGEAIYLAGRQISRFSTYGKERIVIKESMFIVSENRTTVLPYEPLISLLDELISKATSKQCKIMSMKLFKLSEENISKKLEIVQPVVNKQSNSLGWNAIEKSVTYFENSLKDRL